MDEEMDDKQGIDQSSHGIPELPEKDTENASLVAKPTPLLSLHFDKPPIPSLLDLPMCNFEPYYGHRRLSETHRVQERGLEHRRTFFGHQARREEKMKIDHDIDRKKMEAAQDCKSKPAIPSLLDLPMLKLESQYGSRRLSETHRVQERGLDDRRSFFGYHERREDKRKTDRYYDRKRMEASQDRRRSRASPKKEIEPKERHRSSGSERRHKSERKKSQDEDWDGHKDGKKKDKD